MWGLRTPSDRRNAQNPVARAGDSFRRGGRKEKQEVTKALFSGGNGGGFAVYCINHNFVNFLKLFSSGLLFAKPDHNVRWSEAAAGQDVAG